MFSKNFSVAIVVSDAKKSAKWYADKLGLESSVEDHWVTVWAKGGNWKIHLCEGRPDPGNTGAALYVDDVKSAVDALKKKGVKFSQDYKMNPWGETAQLEDPDGNGIWVLKGAP